MGLDNRDYLRDESRRYGGGGGSSFGYSGDSSAPMCRKILIATIAVFVLQILSVSDWTPEDLAEQREKVIANLEQLQLDYGDPDNAIADQIENLQETPIERLTAKRVGLPAKNAGAQRWLQLETPKVLSGQIWRLITCAFCHSRTDLFHILFNMLFLWWFGPKLEAMYGSKEFLIFYLTAAVVASVSYIGLDLVTGDPVPMVGASGAIMAVIMLFAMHFPTTVIYVMFVIPVEIRWIVLFYVIFDLHPVLLALAGESGYDHVAHAAHLGGLAFGYLYGKKQFRLYPFVSSLEMWWRRKKSGFKVVGGGAPRVSAKSQRLADEMDAILKKISEHGEASLTTGERKTLERASRELRDRRD